MATEEDDRGRAARVIRVGIIVFIVGITMVFLPLLIGHTALNKYLVAFGLVGTLVGLSCVTNGAIDRFRARSR
jgi:hypothetical protein